MDAKELAIGDWVFDTIRQKSVRVDSLSYAGIRGEEDVVFYRDDVYEPIPLTDLILKKNGFEYFHKNYASLSYKHPFKLEMEQWPDEDGVGLWKVCGIIEIRFVHELQHTLRLCGIDQKITF